MSLLRYESLLTKTSLHTIHIDGCDEVAERDESARPFGSYPGGASSTRGAGRSLVPSEQAHDTPTGDCRHGHNHAYRFRDATNHMADKLRPEYGIVSKAAFGTSACAVGTR